MKRRTADPCLDYLRELVSQGFRPVDIWTAPVDEDLNMVRVYLGNGDRAEFLIRAEEARFLEHFREAVEFCNFGPRGLASLIHSEAMAFARAQNIKSQDMEVHLSQSCLRRVGYKNARRLSKKLTFRVSPQGSVLCYWFEQIPINQTAHR